LHVSDLTAQFKEIYPCSLFFDHFLAFKHKAEISSQTTVAQSDLAPLSSTSTVAQSVSHKFYLKQQNKVPWILALGQAVRIIFQVFLYFTFLTKHANSSNSKLRTPFCRKKWQI